LKNYNKKISEFKPVIVSNRLPIQLSSDNGLWKIKPGTGGLVTALAPILKNNDGTWVGWPGAPLNHELKQLLEKGGQDMGFGLEMVALSEDDIKGYYQGFSNETIWPLFHDLLDHCNFQMNYWESYQSANYQFAKKVATCSSRGNLIWVHDYHLIMVGHFLKEMGIENSAFFLHIPFPPKDIYIKLPWRKELLEAILSYKLIGFQTERDRRNFIQCVRHLLPEAQVSHHRKFPYIKYNKQICRIGAFPISIDFRYLNELSKSNEVAESGWLFHEKFTNQKIIIGVDRLDYTKGIPHRLEAFENCLERYPELRGKITFVQLVVPSRTEVPEYQALKRRIDEMIGRINGRFTEHGWIPIHYIYGSVDHVELFGFYRSSEIALITPLKDGMNLVAKEYCTACIEDIGVLILSEFAGAASQLGSGSILVNPYNIEEVADAIFTAYYMNVDEQKKKMNMMRRNIMKFNVFRWVDQFIGLMENTTEQEETNRAETVSI